jgi:MFS-type transporter involved in bile tolerance (Atg22 family)
MGMIEVHVCLLQVFLFFSLFGAFATCFAAIPRSGNLADYQITTAFIVVSSVFWSISSAIYNSYLPILVQNDSSLQYLLNEERSSPSIGGQGKIDRMNEKVTDRLSSFGNSAGFAASILIAGCTLLISTYLAVPATYTAGLLLSGCWWLLFTTPAIFFLTSRPGVSLSPDSNHIIHSVLSSSSNK